MWQDPIVEEVRRVREEHAKKFNNDLHAICEDFRKRQRSSGHRIVSRQPRIPIDRATQQGASAAVPASRG
jgi:hypothetical protein